MGRLLFLICVDSDPDRPEYGGARYDCPDKLAWRALPELAKKFSTLRSEFSSKLNSSLKFTWFMRSDLQIQKVYGDAAWCLKNFESMWKRLSDEGDELAWHPHAWYWNDSRKCWYNEISESENILKSYDVGFMAFKDKMGFSPAATRSGINFHNSRTLERLDELGIKADLSANPRLKLFYARPAVGGSMIEGYDWSRAPVDPYHPSRFDYQLPAGGNEALSLIEIPLTTWRKDFDDLEFWRGLIPVCFFNGTATTGRPIMKGWFVADVWGDPFRFELAFNHVLRKASKAELAHFASALHPDDITDRNYRRLRRNLSYAISAARQNGMELEFVTASEAHQIISGAGELKIAS